MFTIRILIGLFLAFFLQSARTCGQQVTGDAIDIGTRRELFVDRYLIDELIDARLELHHPMPAETAIRFDNPWEGAFSGYATVIKDGDIFRMYYRGLPEAGRDGTNQEVTCYAVSLDGKNWTKPKLGIHERSGSRDNNIILMNDAPASHNFAPFLDTNPDVKSSQRYKALAGTQSSGLIAFVSPDGINWQRLQQEAVFRQGVFDSQNVSFWSESEQKYLCYFRTWTGGGYRGYRTISRTTSDDFVNWSAPEAMQFGDVPAEHLYTNQTIAYFRAPHIYLGLAARFMPGRQVVTSEDVQRIGVNPRYSRDCSDSVLLTSRGGNTYDRFFMESLLRPGAGQENWVSRSNYLAHGIVATDTSENSSSREISIYMSREYGQPTAHLQRYVLRTDGFASLAADYHGGFLVTRPIKFSPANETELAAKRLDWSRRVKRRLELPSVVSESAMHGKQALQISGPIILDLPDTKILGEQFTLAAMVKDVPAGHRRLFSAYNGGSTSPNELVFDFDAAGNFQEDVSLRFHLGEISLTADMAKTGCWSRESGDQKPHHIAVVWNQGDVRLYFDGQQVAEKQVPNAAPVNLALGNLRFGEDYGPTSLDNEPFIGIADDVLVLKTALDAKAIKSLFETGLDSLDILTAANQQVGIALAFEKFAVDSGAGPTDLEMKFSNPLGQPVSYVPGIEFAARQLTINMSTSAAGSIRVEFQNADGQPIPGFTLADCDEIIGDQIQRVVSWRGLTDVSSLAGQPVRIKFALKDANIYSFRFE